MAGRSLRPRRDSVDYTGSQATNSTPRWLKTANGLSQEEGRLKEVKEKENDSPPSAHKEPTGRKGSRKTSVEGQDEKGPQKGEAKKGRQATKKRQSESVEEVKVVTRAEGGAEGNVTGKEAGHPLKEVVPTKKAKKGKDASKLDAAKESGSEAEKSDPERPAGRRTTRRLSRLSQQQQQPGATEKTPPKKAAQPRKRQAQEAHAAEDASPQKKQRVEGKHGQSYKVGKEEAADEVALDPSRPRTRSHANSKAAEEARKPACQPAAKSQRPIDQQKAPVERTAADVPKAWQEQAAEGSKEAAAPADCAAPAPQGAGASAEDALLPPAKDFSELQAQYKALQEKYSELKMHRIMDIESTITDIRDQEQSRSRKALQLATHWEAEAQRQAAIAQFGDTATLEKEVDKLKDSVIEKEQLLLEFHSKMMEKEEEVVELKRRMGELVRLVEQFEETRPDAQEEEQPQKGDAPAADGQEEAMATCPTAVPDSAKRPLPSPALVHSTLRSAKAMQQSGARAAFPPPSGQASPELDNPEAVLASILNLDTPAESIGAKPTESTGVKPAKEAGVKHIKEAVEWCPEGASLSKPYIAPTGDVGAGSAQNLQSADRPLVPYQMGQSVQQQPPSRSRFAKEAATARGDQEVPAAHERMAHSVNGTSPAGRAEKVQNRDTPLVERQLAFTPLAALENTGGQLRCSAKGSQPPLTSSITQGNLTKLQTATDEALLFFAELKLEEQTGGGGFKFTHAPTGFTFEIAPDGNEEGDDFEGGLTFKPLVLGSAEELLPPFLKEELRFAPSMRLRLVSNLFKFLGGAK